MIMDFSALSESSDDLPLSQVPGIDSIQKKISIENVEKKPKSVEEWATENVEEWLIENGFEEEAQFFKDEKITGKSLMEIEKADLKEIGITALGRRLELMKKINELQKQRDAFASEGSTDGSSAASMGQPIWLRKVTKEKKKEWYKEPKAKNMYLEKIALINQESRKIWQGNITIHFKNNEDNKLKLEELVSKLEASCMVPEIGFGREAIRSHILQWAHERNRRISDGYDYEAHHKPAKRARVSPPCTSSSTSSTETEGLDASQSETEEPSSNIEDMSLYSARIMMMVVFGVNSLQMLTVKHHLLPLAKLLKVKVRALGKYQMIVPLAKALLQQSYVTIPDSDFPNYKHLKRDQLVVKRQIDSIIRGTEESDVHT